jgi:putative ABC transport system substrate-binding protein
VTTRRTFVTLLGGAAAAWPVAARAQQPVAIPVVGMLNGQSAGSYSHLTAAFRMGLKDVGFVEGQNVLIEYRWADGHDERLPPMAAELVSRPVAVLVTGGSIWSSISAKAATTTIPIVFTTGSDPVKLGLVASFNRPGGNVTGVNFLVNLIQTERMELATELIKSDAAIGLFARPNNPTYADDRKEIEAACASLGRRLVVFDVHDEGDFAAILANVATQRVGVLLVHADPYFNSHRASLVRLAARHAVPAIYELREYVVDGGLMSYGTSITSAYHQSGLYVGRILNGEKPADLPVMQSSRFELIINMKTAKALGLEIPPTLLARADEVIE